MSDKTYTNNDLINGLANIADKIQWIKNEFMDITYNGTHNGIAILVSKTQERNGNGSLTSTTKIFLNNETMYSGNCTEVDMLLSNIDKAVDVQYKIKLNSICNKLFSENF